MYDCICVYLYISYMHAIYIYIYIIYNYTGINCWTRSVHSPATAVFFCFSPRPRLQWAPWTLAPPPSPWEFWMFIPLLAPDIRISGGELALCPAWRVSSPKHDGLLSVSPTRPTTSGFVTCRSLYEMFEFQIVLPTQVCTWNHGLAADLSELRELCVLQQVMTQGSSIAVIELCCSHHSNWEILLTLVIWGYPYSRKPPHLWLHVPVGKWNRWLTAVFAAEPSAMAASATWSFGLRLYSQVNQALWTGAIHGGFSVHVLEDTSWTFHLSIPQFSTVGPLLQKPFL